MPIVMIVLGTLRALGSLSLLKQDGAKFPYSESGATCASMEKLATETEP